MTTGIVIGEVNKCPINTRLRTIYNRRAILLTKGKRIRNGAIRRDFKRLLEIIAVKREPDYEEVEALANRNAMYFDDYGAVKHR